MCVMVTDVKGTEDFQPWVLMSNELVMATCTVNNKSLQLTNFNFSMFSIKIENTLTNRSPLQPIKVYLPNV